MGLSNDQLFNMTLWQYGAYCEAYSERAKDELCLKVQAAYYCAYWNSGAKHKVSLDKVLKKIRGPQLSAHKGVPIETVRKDFKEMEDLMTNGWTKCN